MPEIHTNQRSSYANAPPPEATPAAGKATGGRAPLSSLAGRVKAVAADVVHRAVHIGLVLARFALARFTADTPQGERRARSSAEARSSTGAAQASPGNSQQPAPAPADSTATKLRALADQLSTLESGYRTAAKAAIHGILKSSPTEMLHGLYNMEEGFAPLRELHTQGHVRSVQDGADKRRALIGEALRELSDEDVRNASVAIHSQDSRALLSGLFAASAAITKQGEQDRGGALKAMGVHFEDLSHQLANELADRARSSPGGTGHPIPRSSNKKVPADRMPPEVRDAFRTALGIDCEPQGAPRFRLP